MTCYKSRMTKRILVVDDEIEFSALLQFRLANRDYEVLATATGNGCLLLARSALPDAILLDLLLPDLDGLTVCERLRRLPSTRQIPIIMITAVSDVSTRVTAKLAGACGFLGKPLDFSELQWQLEVLLREPSGRPAIPNPINPK